MDFIFRLLSINLLPLIGIIWYGWTAQAVVVLFWWEAVIIWVLYMPRILFAYGNAEDTLKSRFSDLMMYIVMGAFMLLMSAVGVYQAFVGQDPEPPSWLPFAIDTAKEFNLYWALLLITISYTILLIVKYFLTREYLHVSAHENISGGFLRPGILIFTLVVGGWILQLIEQPIWAIVAFLIMKAMADRYVYIKVDIAATRQKSSKEKQTISYPVDDDTNDKDSKRTSPVTIAIILAMVVIAFTFTWVMINKQDENQQKLLDSFITAILNENNDSAYSLYQAKVRNKWSYEKFVRAVKFTRITDMQLIKRFEHDAPYKNNYGSQVFWMRDSKNQIHQFTVVYGGLEDTGPGFSSDYAVRRFAYDSYKIKKALKKLIQKLLENDYRWARAMSYLHVRNPAGDVIHTLTGEELKRRFDDLGILSSQSIQWQHPQHENEFRAYMNATLDDGSRIRFTVSSWQERQGESWGISLSDVEKL